MASFDRWEKGAGRVVRLDHQGAAVDQDYGIGDVGNERLGDGEALLARCRTGKAAGAFGAAAEEEAARGDAERRGPEQPAVEAIARRGDREEERRRKKSAPRAAERREPLFASSVFTPSLMPVAPKAAIAPVRAMKGGHAPRVSPRATKTGQLGPPRMAIGTSPVLTGWGGRNMLKGGAYCTQPFSL